MKRIRQLFHEQKKQICGYQIKPAFSVYVLHGQQGQFCGIQDLILVLNSSSVLEFLAFIGTIVHIFCPKNDSDLIPNQTIFLFLNQTQ